MKLLTFRGPLERAGKIGALDAQGEVVDLNSAYAAYLREQGGPAAARSADACLPAEMIAFIEGGRASLDAAEAALAYIREKKERGEHPGIRDENLVMDQDEIEFLPPILHPGKMISAGMNYAEHLADSGRSAPELPVAFSKLASSLVGHRGNILYTDQTPTLDYEVELAVIIGKKGKRIKRDEAAEYIYGYTIFNDISERKLQLGEMKHGLLLGGKNGDGFGPMGPWITTKEELADPHNLRLMLRVNGESRQDSNTRHMIYDIFDQIVYWSSLMTLYPGDIFATGTPSGVAFGRRPDPEPYYLKPGDTIEAEIEGLGVLRNKVIEEP